MLPNYGPFLAFASLALASMFSVYATDDSNAHTPAPVVKNVEETPQKFVSICEEFPYLRDCLEKMDKRKSAYMRFGRSSPEVDSLLDDNEEDSGLIDMEKRKSAYMRFGKRSYPVIGFGEDDSIASQEVAKRKSAYMRFGKRKSAYMRFGKRSSLDDDEIGEMEKRKSAYMRFGRR